MPFGVSSDLQGKTTVIVRTPVTQFAFAELYTFLKVVRFFEGCEIRKRRKGYEFPNW